MLPLSFHVKLSNSALRATLTSAGDGSRRRQNPRRQCVRHCCHPAWKSADHHENINLGGPQVRERGGLFAMCNEWRDSLHLHCSDRRAPHPARECPPAFPCPRPPTARRVRQSRWQTSCPSPKEGWDAVSGFNKKGEIPRGTQSSLGGHVPWPWQS